MGLLDGKKALIFGVANNKSIAYGIAKQLKAHGAEVGLSYAMPRLEKMVFPIAEEVGAKFCKVCDLANDEEIAQLAKDWEAEHGKLDILVHAVAFASQDALSNRFIETTRDDFKSALDISAYTLVAVTKAFEHLFNEESSVITLTYYGSEKVVPNYNVMGVAKAALEASVRYLSVELGQNGHRINAISAGPIKTLSAAGVAGFRKLLPLFSERAPLGRLVEIEECGDLAVFLASSLSRSISGEVIYVDSGYHATSV